ncbi:MAG: hypothetical protein HZA46_11075 [Planctomycetales bacterium]|nr:hypothetical protein [Planctomycetales bacterium]
MGTVYKKIIARQLPTGAELFTRHGERSAKWKTAKGKARTAKVTTGNDGSDRLLVEGGTYFAKFRNGAGIVRKVPTGCRDETAARRVLRDLERRAELVKAGVMTNIEDAAADFQTQPLETHLAAYAMHLESSGVSEQYRVEAIRRVERVVDDCEFRQLADLNRHRVERWLLGIARPRLVGEKLQPGTSARTRNSYRTDLAGFCNWCIQAGRLTSNPFACSRWTARPQPRCERPALTTRPRLYQCLYLRVTIRAISGHLLTIQPSAKSL